MAAFTSEMQEHGAMEDRSHGPIKKTQYDIFDSFESLAVGTIPGAPDKAHHAMTKHAPLNMSPLCLVAHAPSPYL